MEFASALVPGLLYIVGLTVFGYGLGLGPETTKRVMQYGLGLMVLGVILSGIASYAFGGFAMLVFVLGNIPGVYLAWEARNAARHRVALQATPST